MTATLAPISWTMFARSAPLTKADWLPIINRMVNAGIDPSPHAAEVAESWKIAPTVGLCHDYAVTKRELLLHLGYHAGELLLCEVALADKTHHMVLIVDGLVLDNIERRIVPLSKMRYKVIRQQTPGDPNQWES